MNKGLRASVSVVSVIVMLISIAVVGCGGEFMLPEEYLTDSELLSESMSNAADDLAELPYVSMDNGPYALTNLDEDNEDYIYLFGRFEDTINEKLAENKVTTGEDGNYELKYRLLESQILTKKSKRGKVVRVGRTTVHVRIFDESEEMIWAGEVWGKSENEVPKGVVGKLTDERIIQIKPQALEKGENPFIEPILVTGITGALIYLFAISAK